MALVWNPWALPGFVAAAIALAMAFFALAIGEGRRTNRLLATVYSLYGLAFAAGGLVYSVDEPQESYAWQVVATGLFFPATLLYPAFLGSALSRAPRILRSRRWLLASILAAALATSLCVARIDLVAAGVLRPIYAPYEVAPGLLQSVYFLLAIAVSALGLFLSAVEFRAAPRGTLQRRRAAFFLVAFGIQDTLLAAGAIAATVLLFTLAPLQRMAERVSDAAMPRVHDTAEYRTVRKREVYLAAVESAMEDGAISDRERNVLATLADQLGLGVKETLDIEREARARRGVA